MTVTIASDYTTITLAGAAVDAFVADPTDATLTLDVTFACGTPVSIDIESGDLTGSTFILTPSDISQTTVFTDGVYLMEMTYLKASRVEDQAIVYIDQDVACKLVDVYAGKTIDCLTKEPCQRNHYFWAYAFHNLLGRLNTCSDFTYANACTLYSTMITITEGANDGDCGCT